MEVPQALADAILEGDCVAFVGAGFSWGPVPGWGELLRRIGGEVPGVSRLLESGTATSLEIAGQLIQDGLGAEAFERALHEVVGSIDVNEPRLAARRRWLLEIPFHHILTTNFDSALTGEPPSETLFGEVLHSDRPWWKRRDWLSEGPDTSRVIKLHGDANGDPGSNPVVLSRRAYRELLYKDRRYGDFLRTVFATRTLLFLGTSFTDAYVNELRSQVQALVGQRSLSWAVLPDRSPEEQRYFEQHEGIGVLSYESDEQHTGFDRWLEAIHDRTSTQARLRRLLGEQAVVWVDEQPENVGIGLERLRKAGATVELLKSPDALEERRHAGAALVISQFGFERSIGFRVLARLSQWGERPPAVIFATGEHAAENRRAVLRRGGVEYCSDWQALFRTIERLFLTA